MDVGIWADPSCIYAGVTVLSSGNFVVLNSNWHNGTATLVWGSHWEDASTGVNGVVSAANSLVGSTANDQIGIFYGVMALSNGNYVVASPDWHDGAAAEAGAVTWGNGATGGSGEVSAANSLVGSSADDQVGGDDVADPGNGNYVVISSHWHNDEPAEVGAVTWGNGATGVRGEVFQQAIAWLVPQLAIMSATAE